MTAAAAAWPELGEPAYETLHLWTQIVGKVRLVHTPWINHSWHVPLYSTARGLTTSPIPHGDRSFEIDFDFIDHQLVVKTDDGDVRTSPLEPRTVADFHAELMRCLDELGLPTAIHPKPNEVDPAIPFSEDDQHASYDPDYAHRLWRAWLQIERVFRIFRARFLGKCSPIHFFWGSFDLAVTRFSGRTAPPHPGGVPNLPDWVAREAYSHEVSSCGFWPGGGPHPFPLFYAYAYPQPEGFESAPIRPEEGFWSTDLSEFVLPYEAVRCADAPDQVLLDFLQSTYEAAANLARWDREALEAKPGFPRSA